MNKLDRSEQISREEFEILKRADKLMDQDIIKDKDELQRMQMYESFSLSIQKEIGDNNERIERHEKKLSDYITRLNELNPEDNEISSNDSSSSNNESNSGNNSDNNNHNNPDSNVSNTNANDEFDDFPPSFDFDDF